MSDIPEIDRAVAAIIAKHLPPAREGQASNDDEAFYLRVSAYSYAGGYRVANGAAERQRLKDMSRAAREISRLYREMHPLVRMEFKAARLADLAEIVAREREAAEATLKRLDDEGRINWRAVSLVGDCRDLWRRRVGRDAPKSDPKKGSRFGMFLADVLDAYQAGRPIPAVRAWRRAHS